MASGQLGKDLPSDTGALTCQHKQETSLGPWCHTVAQVLPIEGLTLLSQLEYSGVITAHYSLDLPNSSNPPASASPAAGTTGMHLHTLLIFVLFVETGFTILPRLASNVRGQAIDSPQPPKVLGFQEIAPVPSALTAFNASHPQAVPQSEDTEAMGGVSTGRGGRFQSAETSATALVTKPTGTLSGKPIQNMTLPPYTTEPTEYSHCRENGTTGHLGASLPHHTQKELRERMTYLTK
ncbi:hypothetical protein AAY473_020048, partial [Plecturocebus cupreus]